MKINLAIVSAAVFTLTVSACSSNGYADGYSYSSNAVVSKVKTPIGELFATEDGMTLYTFTKDTKGKSNCYDACANNWPPFLAKKDSEGWGMFSIIKRKDGAYQWAYANQPLYTWVGDQKKGDTYGQGIGNAWYVVSTGN